VAGLATAFGFWCYDQLNGRHRQSSRRDVDYRINTTEQHPVFGIKIRQAVLRRGVKLVVADPRRIDMTEFATLHIRQKPGTDIPC